MGSRHCGPPFSCVAAKLLSIVEDFNEELKFHHAADRRRRNRPTHRHSDGRSRPKSGPRVCCPVAATSDGRELHRTTDAPRALVAGLRRQRRLAKAVTRKRKGSNNWSRAAARSARHHAHVATRRRHFLHEVSTRLVNTHDRLVLEDLNTAGMLANRHLAHAMSDARWGEFGRRVGYKQRWRGGQGCWPIAGSRPVTRVLVAGMRIAH
ncbi:transposase [Nocardia sp. NPDC005998]|uniref:transposase n=1 Tax=Nocardia sp. NPDC005998 TaxID=3156894 RepID=UPI0033B17101